MGVVVMQEWLFCSSVESFYVHKKCLELSLPASAILWMCCWCQRVSTYALSFYSADFVHCINLLHGLKLV